LRRSRTSLRSDTSDPRSPSASWPTEIRSGRLVLSKVCGGWKASDPLW